MIIWFTGISGVGKTTIAKYTYSYFKKKTKNLIHIDGDHFRKMFNNDLGYSLRDRNINAKRIISLVSFLNKEKINIIVSANLTSPKYRKYCKKKFKNFFEINISSNFEILRKRDKKKIYKNKNLSNVVGFGIKNIKNTTASYKVINNKSKKFFFRDVDKIIKKIRNKIN